MANNTYVTKQPQAYEITSTELKVTSFTTGIPAFTIIDEYIDYINKSEVLSYKINSYDESIVVYQIVLDFIMETGGVI